jgi:hypothetical protein
LFSHYHLTGPLKSAGKNFLILDKVFKASYNEAYGHISQFFATLNYKLTNLKLFL